MNALRFNPNLNPVALLAGSVLVMIFLSCPARAETYTIQPGDTLSAIAQRFGTTTQALREANGLETGTDQINAGATLKLPGGGSPAAASSSPDERRASRESGGERQHTVEEGDTLSSLARQYGVSVDEFMRVNRLDSATIRLGQNLYVPRAEPVYPGGPPPQSRPPRNVPRALPVNPQPAPSAPKPEQTETNTNRRPSTPSHPAASRSRSTGDSRDVVAGDTLLGIAQEFGVSVNALREANGLSDDTIIIGQTLKIPSPGSEGRSAPAAPRQSEQPEQSTDDEDDQPVYSSVTPGGGGVHEVTDGDTLFGLARRYKVSAEAIRNANSLGDNDIIIVGQKLRIPKQGEVVRRPEPEAEEKPKPAPRKEPEIAEGPVRSITPAATGQPVWEERSHYLDLVAANASTSSPEQMVEQMRESRNRQTANERTAPRESAGKVHVVQPGDTLWKIAVDHGTTIDSLRAINPRLADTDKIIVGQKVVLP